MHYFGYGVETDEQKARDFFVTGAKLGDKYAVMHLYILENKETQKNNKEKPQNLQQYLPKISSLPGNQSSDKEFD